MAKATRPAARISDAYGKKKGGFASMTPADLKRAASKGGRASQASGLGHKWTMEEARVAGRKSGITKRQRPIKSQEANGQP